LSRDRFPSIGYQPETYEAIEPQWHNQRNKNLVPVSRILVLGVLFGDRDTNDTVANTWNPARKI
jgi:hypothetical protein